MSSLFDNISHLSFFLFTKRDIILLGGDIMNLYLYRKISKILLLLLILILAITLIGCQSETEENASSLIKPSNETSPEVKSTQPTIIKEVENQEVLNTELLQTNTVPNNENYIIIEKSPYKELFTRNNDYIGWITIDNTNIDLPIVKGEDNDEYLRRNFDYEYAKEGSIFMDYRNFGFGFSLNTILYGHNLTDDRMFGDLNKYSDPEYALEHTIIEITDLYGIRRFQIFSSYYGEANSDLISVDFDSDTFSNYLDLVSDLSTVDYNLSPTNEDYILTLVTCSYELDDGRFYVHAIEIVD